jgi:hypothetical protein
MTNRLAATRQGGPDFLGAGGTRQAGLMQLWLALACRRVAIVRR